MGKQIENDPMMSVARSAVIVANVRTGGTFLAHCLSNHPQIYCDRGETLHYKSIWHTRFTTDRVQVLDAILHQTGYPVSMCRIAYQQAFKPEVLGYLKKRQPDVIWLTRDNKIRQAVSFMLNRLARQGKLERPAHTFEDVAAAGVELEPERVLAAARYLTVLDERAEQVLAKMGHVIHLRYTDLVGSEQTTAERLLPSTTRAICLFLDVRYQTLACDLRRVNPHPLRETVANWWAVKAAMRESEFAQWLEDEKGERWTS